MFNENFKRLAEYVIVNNQLLQALLVLQIGEEDANKVYKEIVKEVDKDFKIIEKEIKKEGKKNENN